MNNGEYDPQEDPIYLQRRQIEILEAIHGRLKEIRDQNERQEDIQDSIKRTSSAINTNIISLAVIVIISTLILVFV